MAYVKVAQKADLPLNSMIKVKSGDRTIMLANVDDNYYALNNRCPHMGGSLADGKLNGHVVTCPRHGSQFDVRTGEALHGPTILLITMKVGKAASYPVKTDGDDILADLD